VVAGSKLDHLAVAVSSMSNDPVDIDDVAAVNANKPVLVEPRFHFADRQWTKELEGAVEDIGVVSIGVNSDNVFDGNELRRTVSLDRQVLCNARRRRTGTAERCVGSSAELSPTISAFDGLNRDTVGVGDLQGQRWFWRAVRQGGFSPRAVRYEDQQEYAGHTESHYCNDDCQQIS